MKQTVRYLGHKWYVNNNSTLGKDYKVLKRVGFLSDLKRFGSVATEIDVHKNNFHLFK